MPVVNEQIVHIWDLASNESSPLTGLAGNMSMAGFNRFPTATTQAAATETVAFAEIGSTGIYTVIYTPTLAQLYKGIANESSLDLEYSFEDDVLDAATAAVADNAYCNEADVVSWARFTGDFTASTTPTEADVLKFMQVRAAQLYGIVRECMGDQAVGPTGATGYSSTLDTSTDVGFALGEALRGANAVLAAMDALEAAGASESPARTERVKELSEMAEAMLPSIKALAIQYVGSSERSSNHISSGFASAPSVSTAESAWELPSQDTDW